MITSKENYKSKNLLLSQTLHRKFNEYFGSEVFQFTFSKNLYSVHGNSLIIEAPNQATANAMTGQYFDHIKHICNAIWRGQLFDIKITVGNHQKYADSLFSGINGNVIYNNFGQDKYRFDNFIPHASNELALQASKMMAGFGGLKAPSGTVCFIYGDVGVGKTHLSKAAELHYRANNMGQSVYMSSESFVGDFISSVKSNTVFEFKKKMSSYGLLAIDDIHSMSGKKASTEEMSNIIMRMLDEGKNVILTSAIQLSELSFLSSRLISRISSGINVCILQPDIVLKKKVINCMVSSKNVPITLEGIDYLAKNVIGNLREIKGAVNRIAVASSLYKTVINSRVIYGILSDMLAKEDSIVAGKRILGLDVIASLVADYYNISLEDMLSSVRTHNVAKVRAIAIYVSRFFLRLTYQGIATFFANRTHAAAIQAYKKIEKELVSNEILANDIRIIKKSLDTRYGL